MMPVYFLLIGLFVLHAQSQIDSCLVGTNMVQAYCLNDVLSEQQFWLFSTNHAFVPPVNPGRTVVGPGAKVLFDFRSTPAAPGFWFADMTRYPSHDPLITALGLRSAYDGCTSCFWRCDFQSYILPNGDVLLGFTYNYGAAITETMMNMSCELAAPRIPIRNKTKVGFVSLDPTGRQVITPGARARCESLGFVMTTGNDILTLGSSNPYIPLHEGDAYGILREFPQSTSLLAPTDIPVFNQLPLDLSVVSGVVTSVFQTVNSHINLKSGERDTPNMILLNYDRYPCIKNFVNKPVHLKVASYGWSLENTTAELVNSTYAQRLAEKKWLALYHDTSRTILSYDDMCPPDEPEKCIPKKKIVGTKAASLGFLRNKHVIGKATDPGTLSNLTGYDITPIGFGIPFQLYVDFINFPPNANLKALIAELNDKEMNSEPLPDERFAMSKKLKEAFWNATVPPDVIRTITDAIAKYLTPYKVNQLKFRSSSNAEDLPGFDGAGLYDSFSVGVGSKAPKDNGPCRYNATRDDMQPASLDCALKGVYGSLWNQRAIEERTFARYRHDSCVMGVAVIPQYKELGKVTANAVSITRLIDGNTEKPGYTFSMQSEDNDVTNPEPGTQSETSIAAILPNMSWFWLLDRPAITTVGGTPLSTYVVSQELRDLMMKVILASERAYCIYKFNLSEATCNSLPLNNVKTALDQEFKFIDNTRIHCKQLREFSGTKKRNVLVANASCGWRDPGYFGPVNGVTYNNIVNGRPITSGTVRTVVVPISNGASSNVQCWPNKSVDGVVEFSLTTITAVNTFWETTFDLPYTIQFLRIFWCGSDLGSLGTYTRPATISVAFTLTNSSVVTQSVTTSAPPQLVNFTPAIQNVTKIRMSTTTSFLCFSEVQFFAPPYRTGNVSDFILENRTDTQDCVWGLWSDWGPCSVPCAGGTQTRTRGGEWCVNYVTLDVFSQNQSCNMFVCPVDCVWNEWSSWAPCSTCKWTNRSRTNVPEIGTGKPCNGAHSETKECLLDQIPCLKAPPVEFMLYVPPGMDVSNFTSALTDLIVAILSLDKESLNFYVNPMNSTAYHVLISFNDIPSNSSEPMPLPQQNSLAQLLSNKLATDPKLTSLFTNSYVSVGSVNETSLGSYSVGYGVEPSPSGLALWMYAAIGAGALLLIIIIVVIVVVSVHNKPMTVEDMVNSYSEF